MLTLKSLSNDTGPTTNWGGRYWPYIKGRLPLGMRIGWGSSRWPELRSDVLLPLASQFGLIAHQLGVIPISNWGVEAQLYQTKMQKIKQWKDQHCTWNGHQHPDWLVQCKSCKWLVSLALSDTHVFLLNEYFIELNTANFKMLNKSLNWILSGNRQLNQLLN